MIEAEGLTKEFDQFLAVSDLDLRVDQGELLALLGPNGAGKTTTVRMLGAILRPTSGVARVNGYDVVEQASLVRRSVGMLTEQPGLYPRMSGLEYMTFYGRLYGLDDDEIQSRTLSLFERFGMLGVTERRLGTYSKGMRQKVGLIRCMLHDPTVLLLDEPTSALDPYSARLVRDAIRVLREGRRSIILCTHNLAEAEELADRIAIISRGQIVVTGTAAALRRTVLGVPLYELRLDGPVRPLVEALEKLVMVEHVNESTVRYRTEHPEAINPRLVEMVSGLGGGVVTLQEVPYSLEDVYLSVLGGDAQEASVEE
jgi:ABC-2 type transport system ATP-binding protein